MIQTFKTLTGTDQLTLAEAKEWLRISDDPSADDTLITDLITQSRELIEQTLNITITDGTIKMEASERDKLTLLFQPVINITSVQDRDANDLDYTYDGFKIYLNTPNNLIVTYNTGYGASLIPSGLKLGWKKVLMGYYENRGSLMNENFSPMLLIKSVPELMAYSRMEWFPYS